MLKSILIIKYTNYKVILDPSHGTGGTEFVLPLSKAAIVSGLDGVMIEMHPEPHNAMSDKDQANSFDNIKLILKELKKVKEMI